MKMKMSSRILVLINCTNSSITNGDGIPASFTASLKYFRPLEVSKLSSLLTDDTVTVSSFFPSLS